MSIFKLPDLGEGLQEAEIREWHVKEGDTVKVDQPLLSVETAKAVVEVPSPQAGKILKLHGKNGDIMAVGKPLVEFEGGAPVQARSPPPHPLPQGEGEKIRDTGVVVGAMPTGNQVVAEKATTVGDIGAREQKLRDRSTLFVESAAISAHQKALANRGSGLLFRQPNSALAPDGVQSGAN